MRSLFYTVNSETVDSKRYCEASAQIYEQSLNSANSWASVCVNLDSIRRELPASAEKVGQLTQLSQLIE